ncbi:MAG: DUF559 domain-containing protein [Pseudomonadota bacterium]
MTRTNNKPSFRSPSNQRAALLAQRAGAMRGSPTATEELLWARIRGRRLGAVFRRQVPLLGRFIADFSAPAQRLVIEVDGAHHGERGGADARRDAALDRAGYRVIRIEASLVGDIGVVLDRIRAARSSDERRILRASGDGSKNLRLVVSNPAKKPERAPPKPPNPPEVPLIVRLLALAREWQGLIDRDELRTQAELAARSGLHPYRVSNILCLLRLHPAILAHIARLEAGTPNDLNERWLRPIARLPYPEQLAAVAQRLGVGTASVLSEGDCG